MTEMTPLDTALAQMLIEPEDEALRLGFYNRLADSELMLLLTAEAEGDIADPQTFETSDGPFVLAFDREDRLTGFTGAVSPYLALSGRSLARMLGAEGVGLALNLGVEGGEYLVPPDALVWLSDLLAEGPGQVDVDIAELLPPKGLPETLLSALDAKLATAIGLAEQAYLCAFRDGAGGAGHVLGFVNAAELAQGALAGAVSEALVFSGLEAGVLDVGFFAEGDPVVAQLQAVGLRFDLPVPETSKQVTAPGMDPETPPRLR
ncbi:MAG: SseB family protein [Paracoccaceae bacterium]